MSNVAQRLTAPAALAPDQCCSLLCDLAQLTDPTPEVSGVRGMLSVLDCCLRRGPTAVDAVASGRCDPAAYVDAHNQQRTGTKKINYENARLTDPAPSMICKDSIC